MSSDTDQRTHTEFQTLTTEQRLDRAHELVDEACEVATTAQGQRLCEMARSRLANIQTDEDLSEEDRYAIGDTANLLGSIAETRTSSDDATYRAREAHHLLEELGKSRGPTSNGVRTQ